VGKPGGCYGRPIVAGSSCEHVRNVSLEQLNRVFLAGDDPLDRVTDGDHANDFGLLGQRPRPSQPLIDRFLLSLNRSMPGTK
jgi:hypothetical protein